MLLQHLAWHPIRGEPFSRPEALTWIGHTSLEVVILTEPGTEAWSCVLQPCVISTYSQAAPLTKAALCGRKYLGPSVILTVTLECFHELIRPLGAVLVHSSP
ncbi:hypothetical protein NDU88_000629 [Pleurodeles waltl]|uniref:Uncharacterized protein n=1 Tax=Pleurodeles waltl TaxID=8319 RepID=A0AAV7V9L1_PLEWA|nr:hypothetical protein NDU88_000629 [Pleurodeles waltl]